MKRIMIAGTNSGCGKTTLTCGILQALCRRGLRVSSFKCGPDYIDPMFHERIIGTRAYHLDSFFCGDDTLNFLLNENAKNSDIAVVEGVMGFYDGYGERGSAYSVSQVTETPVILVVDCKGMSGSIGAVMKGYLEYRKPNRIAGFIFNRLPERLIGQVKELCKELHTEYLGVLPVNDFVIESRHLGLVTANEIDDLKDKVLRLGELIERNILLDKISEISDRDPPKYKEPEIQKGTDRTPPVIAVSKDSAFCFEYSENTALLEKMGCEIKYFSPLSDRDLPENSCGLILCGGYPELYAKRLSENRIMLEILRKRIGSGLPTLAECGGFIYLHNSFEDKDGIEYGGVGIIDGKAFKTAKLQRFGYLEMTAERDGLLCKKGERILAHEFHYWDSTSCGADFTAKKSDGRSWKCIHTSESLYTGFPHLYFYSDIKIAENFVRKCVEYGKRREPDGK